MKNSKQVYKRVLIAFVCIAVLEIFALLTWPLPLMLFGEIFGGLVGFLTHTVFWSSVGVVFSVLLAFVLFVIFIWPVIAFVVKRICVYVSLACLCVGRRYKFRVTRVPFASLCKMNADGDMTVSSVDGTLQLHFLDIIYPGKRMLTFPSECEYVVTPTSQGSVIREGVGNPAPVANSQRISGHRRIIFRASGYSVQRNKDRVKRLPVFDEQAGVRHIIIMQTLPVDVNVIQPSVGKAPVTNGTSIGSFTFYTVKHLKRKLKNPLHSSLFCNE